MVFQGTLLWTIIFIFRSWCRWWVLWSNDWVYLENLKVCHPKGLWSSMIPRNWIPSTSASQQDKPSLYSNNIQYTQKHTTKPWQCWEIWKFRLCPSCKTWEKQHLIFQPSRRQYLFLHGLIQRRQIPLMDQCLKKWACMESLTVGGIGWGTSWSALELPREYNQWILSCFVCLLRWNFGKMEGCLQ